MQSKLRQQLIAEAQKNRTGQPEIDRNVNLKLQHSCRVQIEAEAIGASENFTPEQQEELSAAAILHDISRFEQFRLHQSFDDRKSFDHGHRSVELIEANHLLADFPLPAQRRILNAVEYHNKIAIPATYTGWEKLLALAVRDADKIDIMRVLRDDFDNPAVLFDLGHDQWQLTPEVYQEIRLGHPVKHALLRTPCDFLASKYQWSLELNFAYSRRTFLERGYFKSIQAQLPDTTELRELFELAQEHLSA